MSSSSRLLYPGGASPPLDGKTPVFEEVGADPTVAPGLDRPPGSIAKHGADYYWKFDTGATDWTGTPFQTGGGGTDVVADWALGTTRFYAVGAGGSDAAAGFSDTSAAAAWAVRKLTWAGLLAILPRLGAKRDMLILIGPATYAEDFVFVGFEGWNKLHIVATTDGSDSATDRILSGCVQAYAGSGAGGVWTSTGASTTSAITKGDAAALPSEANGLVRRVRFTGNVTAGLANQCRNIWQISGAVITPGLNTSVAAANGDTFHIEKAGAIFNSVYIASVSAFAFTTRGLSSAAAWDEYNVRGASRILAACEAVGAATFVDWNALAFASTYRHIDNSQTVVGWGLRAGSMVIRNGYQASADSSGSYAGQIALHRVICPDWANGGGVVCFGGDAGNALLIESCGSSRNIFGLTGIGAQKLRIEGRLTLAQFLGIVQGVQIQNAASPVVLVGPNNRVFLQLLSGATGNTGPAVRTDECQNSVVDIDTAVFTLSAADGDILFSGGAYGNFADLAKTNVHDVEGNEVRDRTTGSVLGPGQCVLLPGGNHAGVALTVGSSVYHDGTGAALSDADALASARSDGITITKAASANGSPVFVAAPGSAPWVNPETVVVGGLAYVSVTAGRIQGNAPAVGDFKCRLGRFLSGTDNTAGRIAYHPELIGAPADGEA